MLEQATKHPNTQTPKHQNPPPRVISHGWLLEVPCLCTMIRFTTNNRFMQTTYYAGYYGSKHLFIYGIDPNINYFPPCTIKFVWQTSEYIWTIPFERHNIFFSVFCKNMSALNTPIYWFILLWCFLQNFLKCTRTLETLENQGTHYIALQCIAHYCTALHCTVQINN